MIIKHAGDMYETEFGNLKILKLLGKGKSGYSYLIENGTNEYVLKIMHDEPCPYYEFKQNKVALEFQAYEILNDIGLPIPKLYYSNEKRNFLIKEYIDGITGAEWIASNSKSDSIISQIFDVFKLCKKNNINIDYFPTNFIINDNNLFYIDYEINEYLKEWDLLNWGIYYWANNSGMKEFLENGDASKINIKADSGIPIKEPFYEIVSDWKSRFE